MIGIGRDCNEIINYILVDFRLQNHDLSILKNMCDLNLTAQYSVDFWEVEQNYYLLSAIYNILLINCEYIYFDLSLTKNAQRRIYVLFGFGLIYQELYYYVLC